MKLFFALFALISFASVQTTNSKKVKMAKVQMYGSSGKFEVCPDDDCAEKSITVQIDFIRELDTKGKKVSGHYKESMASTTFAVGATESLMMGEPLVNATKYPFSTAIELQTKKGVDLNAVLRVDTYTFPKPTTVVAGNTSVNIMQDAMKFDISVSGWTFEDPMNTLEVGVALKWKGAKIDQTKLEDGPDTKAIIKPDGKDKTKPTKTKKVDFGNMYFDTPESAMYDGVERPVLVGYSSSGSKTSVITFTFSSFTDTVMYDPTIGGNSAARILPGFAVAVVLLVSHLVLPDSCLLG